MHAAAFVAMLRVVGKICYGKPREKNEAPGARPCGSCDESGWRLLSWDWSAMRFFFFGLLRDADIVAAVLGPSHRGWRRRPARLGGYRLERLRGESFPVLVADPSAHVTGDLVEGLGRSELARIRFYESVEYEPTELTVRVEGGEPVRAHAFVMSARGHVEAEPWSLDEWRARHKARDLAEAVLWMSLHGRFDVAEADRLWDEALTGDRPFEAALKELIARRLS